MFADALLNIALRWKSKEIIVEARGWIAIIAAVLIAWMLKDGG
jgi:hypothetical protein